MAERSSFFDSIKRDRVYFAADWALHLSQYFTNGIFNNGLMVSATDEGMSIQIASGHANINGYRYINDSRKVISISNADGVLNRVDNVVIRLDMTNRQITTEVITGNFAEDAVAPMLIRGTNIYELRIATISIPAGITKITDDLIEDTRFDGNDCGNVICAVQTPDFTDIFKQYTALWDKFVKTQFDDFNIWFQDIKNVLDNNTAGHLLNLINTKSNIPCAKNVTLLSTNWILNETTERYEYTVTDIMINKDDYIRVIVLDDEKKKQLLSQKIDSYNGYYTITSKKQPESDIELQLVIMRTKPDSDVEQEEEA